MDHLVRAHRHRARPGLADAAAPDDARPAVRALVRVIQAADPPSRRHCERVADTASLIAHVLGWAPGDVTRLHEAALVHDVGKAALPVELLRKASRLNAAERRRVRAHATHGARMVAGALGVEQASWVRGHHERWDGTGYPDGLRGREIPEGARILAVADAWDVMISRRPYTEPRPTADALAECLRHSGSQFWPAAVGALQHLHRMVPLGAAAPPEPAPLVAVP